MPRLRKSYQVAVVVTRPCHLSSPSLNRRPPRPFSLVGVRVGVSTAHLHQLVRVDRSVQPTRCPVAQHCLHYTKSLNYHYAMKLRERATLDKVLRLQRADHLRLLPKCLRD